MTLVYKPSFVPAVEFIEVSGIQFWSAILAFLLTLIVCKIFVILKFKLFRSPVDKPPDFYESIYVRRVRKEMESLTKGLDNNKK